MKYLMMLLFGFSLTASAQDCLTSAVETTPDGNFVENGDGTVTDTSSGLMWMQCSVGQTWSDGNCLGDASELNWQQALQEAHGLNFADKTGWRLPNIKELATISERQCVRPAINETIFPRTLSDDYWTSSPSVIDDQRAWVIAFFNGSNSIKDKELFVFARLVRNAD